MCIALSTIRSAPERLHAFKYVCLIHYISITFAHVMNYIVSYMISIKHGKINSRLNVCDNVNVNNTIQNIKYNTIQCNTRLTADFLDFSRQLILHNCA